MFKTFDNISGFYIVIKFNFVPVLDSFADTNNTKKICILHFYANDAAPSTAESVYIDLLYVWIKWLTISRYQHYMHVVVFINILYEHNKWERPHAHIKQ